MKKLFLPAVALMNKLSYAQKFIVLGLIYVAAVTVIMTNLYSHISTIIATSQRQAQGIALIKSISHTIQLMQEHRALELAMLSGNEAMRYAHDAKERELDIAALQLNANFSVHPDWQHLEADWKVLRAQEHLLPLVDNFIANTALIEKLQQFKVSIADDYALTFDGDIAFYYLIDTTVNKLPMALEQLSQMRTFGTSILIKKQLSDTQKIKLFILIAELDNALESLNTNLEKTSRYNNDIKTGLLTAATEVEQSAQHITQLVKSDILSEQFATPSETYFAMATAAINNGYEQIYQNLLPSIQHLLDARIQQHKKELQINISIALISFLIVTYIFIGIYQSTVNSVQSLARSAQKFADGDLKARIQLNTSDELAQVGNSFNIMANGFNTLLEANQDDKERLHAIINSAFDAIIQMDADGCITGWNKQAEVIFGWSTAEALGRNMSTTIIPPSYREAHVHGYQNYLKSGVGVIFHTLIELEGLHRLGHEFPIEISVAPVKTARGLEFNSFIRDITQRKSSEQLLRLLSLAVEQSPSSIIITDLDANIEFANKSFSKITGYSPHEIIGQNPRILHSGKTPATTYHDLWATLKRGEIWQGELINRRKDGSEYTELALISPMRQIDGKITHYLAIKEDITEQKRAETELRIAAVAFESQEAMLVSDADNIILRVNKAFTQITGYSADDVIGRSPSLLATTRKDKARCFNLLENVVKTGHWQGEIMNRRKNGNEYPVYMTITTVKDDNALPTHYIITFTDITERKLAEEKINQLAYYDSLTNLPNRRKLLEHLDYILGVSQRKHTRFAVLMMDLDYFKAVNDCLGHLAGDELLQQVAIRVSARLRHTDMIARLGGDEFVILLDDIQHANNVTHIATSIINDLTLPFQLLQNKEVHIGASIGISLYPQHGDTSSSLMNHADTALYQAKNKGRGCYAVFSEIDATDAHP
jgi:diguanylate cyclase (GGDEF)-like protein/PAS domain S-box-containing protein